MLENDIGRKLVAADDGWRRRRTWIGSLRAFCSSPRARFIEGLVVEQAGPGVGQY